MRGRSLCCRIKETKFYEFNGFNGFEIYFLTDFFIYIR